MQETILQFGTGNFLRGFADDFMQQLNNKGLYAGQVVVVSPTDSATVEKINAQGGRYHLLLRGLAKGQPVRDLREIRCISRAINPYRDFGAYLALARQPALRFVISNTTEAGIQFDPHCRLTDRPAASFPAKLTQLLYARYQTHLPGLVILACELIDHNGRELENCVRRYAEQWQLGADFSRWLEAKNTFCSTLVDRIVTGYPREEAAEICAQIGGDDALLDTAEPYHLWVIEGNFEQELPLQAAGLNVVWTDQVAPYKKMKVRILNGAHTALVFPSLLCRVETVGESLKDKDLAAFLDCCLHRYILPTLENQAEAETFAKAVLERFANPYIHHRWQSIALNSISKYTARVLPTLLDTVAGGAPVPRPLAFSLACLIEYYKTRPVTDDPKQTAFIKENPLPAILANAELWGTDLSFLTDTVTICTEKLHQSGVREAMQWSM